MYISIIIIHKYFTLKIFFYFYLFWLTYLFIFLSFFPPLLFPLFSFSFSFLPQPNPRESSLQPPVQPGPRESSPLTPAAVPAQDHPPGPPEISQPSSSSIWPSANLGPVIPAPSPACRKSASSRPFSPWLQPVYGESLSGFLARQHDLVGRNLSITTGHWGL